MKAILLAKQVSPAFKDKIQATAPKYQVLNMEDLTEDNLTSVEIIYDWNQDLAQSIDQFSGLKWVQVVSAGTDYLPQTIRENQDIQITNTSGMHAIGITESVFAFILGLGRGLFPAIKAQMQKEWLDVDNATMTTLPGKTLLIFGAGNIGREIARVGHAFGMKTIGVNSDGRSVDHFDQVYTMDRVDQVLKQAHFVVNAMPLTGLTYQYFDASFFKKMHETAIFINIGRGQSVKEVDLYDALTNRTIRGAYLDVFEQEPLEQDSPLWECPNLIITPHITGKRMDYADLALAYFLENLKHYVSQGQVKVNRYDQSKGY